MNQKHIVPSTLSVQGRVSLSPEKLPLSLQKAALQKLETTLPGVLLADEDILDYLVHISVFFTPNMSESAFTLRSMGAAYSWCQHYLATSLHQNESLRRHIRETLQRCIPAFLVTDDMVTRCESQLSAGDRWDTGVIFRFAAEELLSNPTGTHPLMTKLHASAQLILSSPESASWDDLRLVSLHALYDSRKLPHAPETAFLPLRLGLKDGQLLSVEAVAAKTQLPVLLIREIEAAALQTLIQQYTTEAPHA